ncbi:Riboflavin synthase-like beta-barrel [Penicillium cosmopolitanum]|uniref:ferric-chelate reductase (NADPH) n=1 Tax=Penicillium cosmopolitanum TaxID=1131564 RepID=A0A9X0BAE5_9EURO|nr:Riboflavin synthase-like beta-barrel [Penicillium cosmopolitanum]KAJ5397756.1 Riboflavin synthase-like beta-barrel [Penicillium cosmopolitanum]
MEMKMDMKKMASGVPWLDQPVMLHSSRADKCKLSAEQCAYRNSRWRYWYQADHVYALNTVYLMCAVIAVFAISNLLMRYAPEWVKRTRVWRATTSTSRYMAYRGYRFPVLRYWSPCLGVILLGLAGAVFFLAMTLGPKPYYWPTDANYGSSPPIATRAGWMALALLPFVLVLSAKANMVSALTGIPPEKLQVFHHWTSYAMFVLALVHTFPYIIFHIRKGDMVKQWKTSVVYWTGIPALLSQTYLTVMSLPLIRNRFYEFFKATHMFAAIIFVVFFFLHCDFRLSSWDYFIASGVLYLVSLIVAHVRTYLMHGIHTATLELLPSGLVRVAVPTVVKWTPGQHVFVRFITSDLHLLTSHPFTISSVYRDPDTTGRVSELIFYIKPRQGVTARLAALARKRPGCKKKILIEGPYGGVSAHHLARFDTILVIAGGSGGGFSLAMVDEALRLTGLPADGKSGPQGRRNLQVVFSTRDPAMAEWYVEEVESRLTHSTELLSDAEHGYETSVSVHITSRPMTSQSMATVDSGRGSMSEERKKMPVESTTTGMFSLNVHRDARPDVPGLIARTVAVAQTQTAPGGQRKRIGVLVCGPASMLHDTRNAAAVAQARAMEGDVEELYLHSEPFAVVKAV